MSNTSSNEQGSGGGYLLILVLTVSNPPLLLGGHDSISCEHGSFSGHRHRSNSDMIDMFNHWGRDCWIYGTTNTWRWCSGWWWVGLGPVEEERMWKQIVREPFYKTFVVIVYFRFFFSVALFISSFSYVPPINPFKYRVPRIIPLSRILF